MSSYALPARLVLDGTPESYLEYMVFHLFRGQFYLKRHMKYSTMKVTASKQAIGRLIHKTGIGSRGATTAVIEDVPAPVCDDCGEYRLDENVTKTIHAMAEEAVRHGAELELLRYQAA